MVAMVDPWLAALGRLGSGFFLRCHGDFLGWCSFGHWGFDAFALSFDPKLLAERGVKSATQKCLRSNFPGCGPHLGLHGYDRGLIRRHELPRFDAYDFDRGFGRRKKSHLFKVAKLPQR